MVAIHERCDQSISKVMFAIKMAASHKSESGNKQQKITIQIQLQVRGPDQFHINYTGIEVARLLIK